MAKTLGCMCLVTDDIKERGPHYTLMRVPDSEVMPLSFYEVLLLGYLEARITDIELLQMFNSVSVISNLNLNFRSKLRFFEKRFWNDPYSRSEKDWMARFCRDKEIDASTKIRNLWKYLNN